MGDLLMSSPAIRALKETFHCKITVLTSNRGNIIAPYIKEIDETIVADLPWVKTEKPVDPTQLFKLIEQLRKYQFDAAVIFTVYSQNPLPAAMVTYLTEIPIRISYCRENPYHLLTEWIVEKEPFDFIQHQVRRDLNLVKRIGAETKNEKLDIQFSDKARKNALAKLSDAGIDLNRKWIILHPGVSEKKREYPAAQWIKTGKLLRDELSCQLVITGNGSEQDLGNAIKNGIGDSAFCLSGILGIEEFIALINETSLVVSVNTGTVHIAVATHTPLIVLYALTNPQHTPWKARSSVLFFSVDEGLKSKNEVVKYVSDHLMDKTKELPLPSDILKEAEKLLKPVTA